MRNVGTNVDHMLHSRERVEVFAKGFPFETDARLQGLGGNVFDAIHHADQEIFLPTAHWCKAQFPITNVVTPCQLEGER